MAQAPKCYDARVKTDKLFYRLFSIQPSLLLELAGLPAPYPKGYRQQALELKFWKLYWSTNYLDYPERRSELCYTSPIPAYRTLGFTRRSFQKAASKASPKDAQKDGSRVNPAWSYVR